MVFIDTHAHIDRLKDIEGVIEGAKKAGVGIIVNSGIDEKSNLLSLEYAQKYPEVKAVLGIHPCDIEGLKSAEIASQLKFIEKNKDKIIGIGEVGLDFSGEYGKTKEEQIKLFKKLIKLSIKIDKPIVVHSRKAEFEAIEILEKLHAKKVLMHCFSGKKRLLETIKNNGWLISIPASIKYNDQFQLFAKLMPLENILCETDSPFLHPDRKMDNEPKNVIESYKAIAKIKKLKLKDVEEQVEENFEKLFLS